MAAKKFLNKKAKHHAVRLDKKRALIKDHEKANKRDFMNSTTHVPLFLCELESEEERFYVGADEITRVDVIGTVVYISQRERVTTFEIDDGTGIIQCAKFTNLEPDTENKPRHSVKEKGADQDLTRLLLSIAAPEEPIRLGSLVNVRGRLNIFRDRPQIIVNTLRHVSDANEEWFRILQIDAMRKNKAECLKNAQECDLDRSCDRYLCLSQSQ